MSVKVATNIKICATTHPEKKLQKKIKKMQSFNENFSLFPWDNGVEPYWINPENGIHWYVDKVTSEWCKRSINDWPELKAIVFYVCRQENDKIVPIERVLIDVKTNQPIASDTSLEALCAKIDKLRMASAIK